MRTLGESLQTDKFSDEALAFVNGSHNKPVKRTLLAAAAVQDSDVVETTRSKSNGVRIEPPPESSAAIPGTVSMTFRLPSELSTRLIRTSVERKLKRARPFSQQDIIAKALFEWLEKNS